MKAIITIDITGSRTTFAQTLRDIAREIHDRDHLALCSNFRAYGGSASIADPYGQCVGEYHLIPAGLSNN